MKTIENGLFIALEGGEGSGKTTLASKLQKYYTHQGYNVVLTREPGGNALAEKIRNCVINNEADAITQLFLFAAARRLNVKETIKPALKNGSIVICDRYVTSSLVYQGIVQNVPSYQIKTIMSIATEGLLPEIEILLDISAEEGLKRIQDRENNKFDEKGLEFHTKVNEAYLKISCVNRNRRRIIDASQDPDTVAYDAIEKINRDIKYIGILRRNSKEDD